MSVRIRTEDIVNLTAQELSDLGKPMLDELILNKDADGMAFAQKNINTIMENFYEQFLKERLSGENLNLLVNKLIEAQRIGGEDINFEEDLKEGYS